MLDEGRNVVVVKKYNYIKQVNDVDELTLQNSALRFMGERKQQQKTTPATC